MAEVKVTISSDLTAKLEQLGNFGGNDPIMRVVATTLLGQVHDRIHEKGLNSEGSPIGNYTPGYMKVRTGNFENAKRFTKGKNKGEIKTPGTFTRGAHKGEPRPKYSRTSDTKVVISLTRQMENDFKVVATDRGYGLGYSNPENLAKAGYVEATYGQKIFNLTPEEGELALSVASEEFIKFLNQ
jgi:hypothetical protein